MNLIVHLNFVDSIAPFYHEDYYCFDFIIIIMIFMSYFIFR